MALHTILTKTAGKTWYIPNKTEITKVHEARKYCTPPLVENIQFTMVTKSIILYNIEYLL